MGIGNIWNIFKLNNECRQENATVRKKLILFISNKQYIYCWHCLVIGDLIIMHQACNLVPFPVRMPCEQGEENSEVGMHLNLRILLVRFFGCQHSNTLYEQTVLFIIIIVVINIYA